jgi:hypothetical protein
MKSQLANRIFRTVVMSGAMLATPLAAQAEQAAPPPKQANPKPDAAKAPMPADGKPADAKPDTWESVSVLLVANDKAFDKAVTDFVKARKDLGAKKKTATPETVATAKTNVDTVAKERADLVARLGKTTRPAPLNEAAMPGVEKAETAHADAEAKLLAAIDIKEEVAADWAKNTKAIEAANKTRVASIAKVKSERAKLNKRPRAVAQDRPMGRGFILS